MRKKAQITMESLLLYGAAILVVLIAIAVLTYFGVFNVGSWVPEKCDASSTGMFDCEEYQIDKSGETVKITVRNIAAKPIEITVGNYSGSMITGCANGVGNEIVAPGKSVLLESNTCDMTNVEAGDKVTGTFKIVSKFVGGQLDTTTRVELQAAVQE